jgi:hypothetical protein
MTPDPSIIRAFVGEGLVWKVTDRGGVLEASGATSAAVDGGGNPEDDPLQPEVASRK